jgi:hypothetical protein
MGSLQSCLSLPLHLSLAEDTPGMPIRQSRVGVPEIWTLVEATVKKQNLQQEQSLFGLHGAGLVVIAETDYSVNISL